MFSPEQFDCYSIRACPRGDAARRILSAAFNAVHAGEAVKRFLKPNPLPRAGRIFALGLGKAALTMTAALAESVAVEEALVITKRAPRSVPPRTSVILGDHPIPGEGSLRAGRAALEFVSRLKPEDLLVCLISGGGSALMSAPLIPLDELQRLTSALLANGADISQINLIRRHLDSLKGGGLAQAANGAKIVSLILSDVVGDALETIASGVTAPDPTTREEAREALRRVSRAEYPLRETLKPGDPLFQNVQNHVVANNDAALDAAKRQAEEEGFRAEILARGIQGEAREVGKLLAKKLKEAERDLPRPFCLLAGGETTVTVRGNGKGGRNQETALGAAPELRDMKDVLFVSLATDGEDGPTEAAGAAAAPETLARAEALGQSWQACLSENNAHAFFQALDDLIQPGSSGTNVNDLTALFAF